MCKTVVLLCNGRLFLTLFTITMDFLDFLALCSWPKKGTSTAPKTPGSCVAGTFNVSPDHLRPLARKDESIKIPLSKRRVVQVGAKARFFWIKIKNLKTRLVTAFFFFFSQIIMNIHRSSWLDPAHAAQQDSLTFRFEAEEEEDDTQNWIIHESIKSERPRGPFLWSFWRFLSFFFFFHSNSSILVITYPLVPEGILNHKVIKSNLRAQIVIVVALSLLQLF